MKRAVFFAGVFVVIAALFTSSNASALGLKVAPLEYRSTLGEGERKQGIIDISNPSSQAVSVKTSVQAFRQINDDGGLQFYDDEIIATAISLDLSSFELGPRQAVRMPFVIDGTKLPTGDVYAAVFFTTEPTKQVNGVGQQVRVGTLLSLVNKTPSERSADLTGIRISQLQTSSQVSGSYTVKNTGKTSGFYPTVTLSSWPGGVSKEVRSSLVFAGRERSNEFTLDAGYGISRIDVELGDDKKSIWVIALAPWMSVLIVMVLLIAAIEIVLLRRRRRSSPKSAAK